MEFNMKTKLKLKNYCTFPSKEWGEDGGYSCDVYYDDKKVFYFCNYGDGSEPKVVWENSEIQQNVFDEMSRLSKFKTEIDGFTRKMLKEHNVWGLVDFLVELEGDYKFAEKAFKEGNNVVVSVSYAYSLTRKSYIATVENKNDLLSWIKETMSPKDSLEALRIYLKEEDK